MSKYKSTYVRAVGGIVSRRTPNGAYKPMGRITCGQLQWFGGARESVERSPVRDLILSRVDQLCIINARKTLGLNTSDFGALLGVSGRTVENWEQGRRSPGAPVMLLLTTLTPDNTARK